jgi:uncharacterized repeat protein (TIGR03803 family)
MRRFNRLLRIGCAAVAMAAGLAGSARAASTETVLHSFGNPALGKFPTTGLVMDASTGAFYGSTWEGGANGDGVIYQLLPPTPPATKGTYSVISNNTYIRGTCKTASSRGIFCGEADNRGVRNLFW